MLISDFIINDKLELIENTAILNLLERCLEPLHSMYGFNFEWRDKNNWVFDSLDQDQQKTYMLPKELIDTVNSSFYKMTNSVLIDVYSEKSLFKYKDKPLFRVNGKLITHHHYQMFPLLLGANLLLKVCFDPSPDINTIVTVTELIECSDKIQVMTSINWLWVIEKTRNVNKNISERLNEFDNIPVNKKRRDALGTLVITLLLDDETLSVDEIKKRISKDYKKQLETLYFNNEIKDSCVGENEDVTKVSNSVLKRWIKDIKINYIEN